MFILWKYYYMNLLFDFVQHFMFCCLATAYNFYSFSNFDFPNLCALVYKAFYDSLSVKHAIPKVYGTHAVYNRTEIKLITDKKLS